jgi:hypothetical protein
MAVGCLLERKCINTRAFGTVGYHNWFASLLLLYGNVMNPVFSAYGDMISYNACILASSLCDLKYLIHTKILKYCIRGKKTAKNLVQHR